MSKDNDHRDSDRYGRGRANPKGGTGAYTESSRFKSGDDIGKDRCGKTDRSDSPRQKPYGSMHYPHTKDG
jgi:hypothetical protein